jgi:hypothetical protein
MVTQAGRIALLRPINERLAKDKAVWKLEREAIAIEAWSRGLKGSWTMERWSKRS